MQGQQGHVKQEDVLLDDGGNEQRRSSPPSTPAYRARGELPLSPPLYPSSCSRQAYSMVQYVDLLIVESTYSMVQIKMTQSSVYLHDTIYMVHTVSIYCLCTVCLLHVQIKMCLHIFFSHKQILDVRLA